MSHSVTGSFSTNWADCTSSMTAFIQALHYNITAAVYILQSHVTQSVAIRVAALFITLTAARVIVCLGSLYKNKTTVKQP